MKLSEMLQKAEKKLKNDDEELVLSPWQTTSIETKSTESKNNVGTNVETKSTESKNNVGTNVGNKLYFKIQHLTGIQLTLMHYIYKNKFNENKHFFIHINTKQSSIETHVPLDIFRVSLRRIENKKIIIRDLGVMGRHGFSIFKIPLETIKFFDKFHIQNKTDNRPIYNNIITNTNKYNNSSDSCQSNNTEKDKIIADLQKQLELQNQQINNQSQPFAVSSEKGKLNNIDTQPNAETLTDTQDDSEAWANIDFSALASFGFKKSHIKQIINTKTTLTPQEVQESIEHYAWALNHRAEEKQNYAPQNNRLRGLMGVLKKGSPWIEAQYRSLEDIAIEEQIKAKQAQLERKIAQKEALLTTEFNLWYADLTPDHITEIEEKEQLEKQMSPTAFRTKGDNASYINALKNYFKQHIYTG